MKLLAQSYTIKSAIGVDAVLLKNVAYCAEV